MQIFSLNSLDQLATRSGLKTLKLERIKEPSGKNTVFGFFKRYHNYEKIVITGVAGFIGFHLAKRLLEEQNLTIIGIDNLNNYYSVKLKKDRLKILKKV